MNRYYSLVSLFLTIVFDLSTTKVLSGMFLLIVEPAPTVTCEPIVIGATNTEFAPVLE